MSRSPGTVFPWVFIMLMIGSLFWLYRSLQRDLDHMDVCEENLKQIYLILTLYEWEKGQLPSFELFPEDPKLDEQSILQVLEPFGLDPEKLVCPAAPQAVKRHGVSYLWNPALNHGSLRDRNEVTWVLVDVQALDDAVQGPHFGTYMVLFTDGTVERTRHPPHSLPVQYD